MKTPSYYADASRDGFYDCTSHIGPLASDVPWPMYSFAQPSYSFWNGLAAALYERGWSDEEIKAWLQSEAPRRELDQADIDRALQAIGALLARDAEKVTE